MYRLCRENWEEYDVVFEKLAEERGGQCMTLFANRVLERGEGRV